ncbi:hypothetical protein FACS1894145_8360 [Bacteroidia bacterium]|nr:hypothetical protein FACS1894145_8360 [Bacteroidia bacterium]
MAVLVLGAILAVYLFVYKKFVTGGLFVLFFVFVGAIIINTSYFQGSRMAHLFGKAQEGSMIFEEDGSANDRLAAIAFSVKGCIDHCGMPGGMGTYTDYVEKELPNQSFFRYGGGRGRIMSGYGSALYELGILGLFIPIAFLVVICHYFKQDKKKQIVVFIAFTMLMFTAIPLALPYVSFFYGYLIYYTKNAK